MSIGANLYYALHGSARSNYKIIQNANKSEGILVQVRISFRQRHYAYLEMRGHFVHLMPPSSLFLGIFHISETVTLRTHVY